MPGIAVSGKASHRGLAEHHQVSTMTGRLDAQAGHPGQILASVRSGGKDSQCCPHSVSLLAAAALGGHGGLRGVGVVEADDQAGVPGAVEGYLQSAGLAAVHGGEQ